MSLMNRYLLLLMLAFNSVYAQELVNKVQPVVVQQDMGVQPAPEINALPVPMDLKVMQDVLANFALSQEKKRQERCARMFEKLPEEVKQAVESAKERYQTVALNCNLGDCLAAVCQKVYLSLKKNDFVFQKVFGDQKYNDVLRGIEFLLKALADERFNALLPQSNIGGIATPLIKPLDMNGFLKKLQKLEPHSSQSEPFTMEHVVQLRNLFMESWNVLGGGPNDPHISNIRQEFYFLSIILDAVGKHDMHMLIKQCVARMHPDIEAAIYLLDEAVIKLDEVSETSPLSAKKAIEYWSTELKRYAQSLRVFVSVEQRISQSALSPEQFQKLFSLVAHMYQNFGAEFIRLYKNEQAHNDSKINWWLATALDWTLSSSLTAWYFSHTQEEFLTSFMQMMVVDKSVDMSVFGSMSPARNGGVNGPFKGLNEFSVLANKFRDPLMLSYAMAGTPAFFIMQDPTAWSRQWPTSAKVSSKVFVAFIYYTIFHGVITDPNATWWDSSDSGIRKAVMFSINTGKRHIVQWLQNALHYKNPEQCNEIEKKTFGIVKPELLGAVIDACMPVLLLNTPHVGSVAQFTRKDVYPEEYHRYIPEQQLDTGGFGECDTRYIYRNLFFYVMGSVGEHFGKHLANGKKSYVSRCMSSFLDRCCRGLFVRGWIEPETYEMLTGKGEDFDLDLDDFIEPLRDFILEPSSQIRQLVVWQLKNQRRIAIDEHDDVKINNQMVYMFLFRLAQTNVIDFKDVYKISKFYGGENVGRCLASLQKIFKKTPESVQKALGAQPCNDVCAGVELLIKSLADGSFDALLPQECLHNGMVKQLLNPLDVTKDKQKVPAVEGHKELLTVQQITDLHNLFAESYSLLSKSEDQDSDVLDVRYELFFLLAFLQGIETHDMHVTIQGHLQGTMLMMKDAIKQNFVSMIGGNIGSMVMTLGAWVAWRVYDGYYPVAA